MTDNMGTVAAKYVKYCVIKLMFIDFNTYYIAENYYVAHVMIFKGFLSYKPFDTTKVKLGKGTLRL